MPEKDPTSYALATYAWVTVLSAWGGLANWLARRRIGVARPYSFTELIGEVVISAFAGILTFWLCEAADLRPLITAALVGISGHMGSRAIYRFETWAESRFIGANDHGDAA